MSTPDERNLAAEIRAVEEGHVATWMAEDPPWIKVVSDTFHDKSYRVDFLATASGDPITFICQPYGARAYEGDHLVSQTSPGITGCKHAALAARRLEREGKALLLSGLWTATQMLPKERTYMAPGQDPFEGL